MKSKPLLTIYMAFLAINNMQAQCTASPTNNPGTCASVSFTGSRFAYDIPNNALNADGVFCTANAMLALLYGPTEYLKLTNFNFSIPSNATICGVVATVKKAAANVNLTATVSDNAVYLVKGGIVGGTNHALAGNWTTTNTAFTYGSNADLWGQSLTPADVNASNFGVAFSASINAVVALISSAKVDNIQLTVYYSVSLPVKLVDFNVVNKNNSAEISWKVADANGFRQFELDRSVDGNAFHPVATIAFNANRSDYYYSDQLATGGKYFYRLKQVDVNGAFEYSKIISLENNLKEVRPVISASNGLMVFNNFPAGRYNMQFINAGGQVVEESIINIRQGAYSYPIKKKLPRFFIVTMQSMDGGSTIIKKLFVE